MDPPDDHQGSSSSPLHSHSQEPQRVRFAGEGEEGEDSARIEALRVQLQPPPLSLPQHPSRAHPKSAAAEQPPSVYWEDERDNDSTNDPASQYTFYREGTPTLPDYEESRKRDYDRQGAATAAAAAAQHSFSGLENGHSFPPFEQQAEESNWSTATTSSTSSLITTTSVSSSTTPRPTGNLGCPAVNNTIYNVPNSTKKFLRLCGTDYSGVGSASDVLPVEYTKTMTACIDKCATTNTCTGCAWGFINGDVGGEHRCWMKTNLQTPHKAASDWSFAVL
ncbi:hypothetical protein B0T17DRAFT_552701, partial [Bombardia bombarda]